ncbi:MAG: tetratricopeptide repeat protein [Candidatus Nitrospinota bacterium M3_3B_026]
MGHEKKTENSRAAFRRVLPAAALFAVVLAGYSGTFHHPFQFDDNPAIESNESIRDLSGIKRIWDFNPARFLTFLSLAVNYHLGGLDVFGYHVFNVAVHFLASLCVYWLVLLLISTKAGAESLGGAKELGGLFALFVAVVFAAHPLQTEAVTYIWQRNTSMMALFYILSLALYLKGAMAPGFSRRPLAGAFIFAVAAMFTKQNAVTLPIAILMIEFFFISESFARMKERVAAFAPFVPTILIIPILTALDMSQETGHIGGRYENILTPYEYLLTQFNVIVKVYLKLLVYPVGQVLDYDFPPARSFADSAGSFAFLILIAASAAWLYSRNRLASFGIFFFFLTLSVESSFFPLEDLVFEHRMYLPSAGLFLAVSALLFQAAGRLNPAAAGRALGVLLVILAVALTAGARSRNEVWAGERAMWLDVIEKSPGKDRGYKSLAWMDYKRGDMEGAKKWFEEALKVNPTSESSLLILAKIHLDEGNLAAGRERLERLLEVDPSNVKGRYALGNLYMEKEDYVQAANQYRIALEIEEYRNPEGLMALGTALFNMGLVDQSITAYKRILKLNPRHETALNNLSVLYNIKGDKEKSELYAKKRDEAKASRP